MCKMYLNYISGKNHIFHLVLQKLNLTFFHYIHFLLSLYFAQNWYMLKNAELVPHCATQLLFSNVPTLFTTSLSYSGAKHSLLLSPYSDLSRVSKSEYFKWILGINPRMTFEVWSRMPAQQTAWLIQLLALFSRHPPNQQKSVYKI